MKKSFRIRAARSVAVTLATAGLLPLLAHAATPDRSKATSCAARKAIPW